MIHKYLILFISVCFLLFTGCKVKQNNRSSYSIKSTQIEDISTTLSSVNETTEKSGIKTKIDSNTSEQKNESLEETTDSWKEVNYYDKEGNLIKTVKEVRSKNKKTASQSNKDNIISQADSIYDDTISKEKVDSVSVSSSINNIDTHIDIDQNMQSDSRLIQGVEWFYVVGIFLLIMGLVVFFLRKKIF